MLTSTVGAGAYTLKEFEPGVRCLGREVRQLPRRHQGQFRQFPDRQHRRSGGPPECAGHRRSRPDRPRRPQDCAPAEARAGCRVGIDHGHPALHLPDAYRHGALRRRQHSFGPEVLGRPGSVAADGPQGLRSARQRHADRAGQPLPQRGSCHSGPTIRRRPSSTSRKPA